MRMRGFTLIELIMVIVITGILAAVVGPRFFERQVFDERMFFEESLGAVRYAQKLALASGCLTQVSLDGSGYHLRQAASCNASAGGYTLEVIGPDGQSPYANSVPSSVSANLKVSNFPLVFDSLGRADGAGNVSVGSFTFSVVAATGLVQSP